MKKILIALLVVFLLAGIAVVGVGYYVYRQVRTTAAQFAALAELPEIERSVQARGEFVPPASAELTEAQVKRLMRVQSVVRQRLGQRFGEFQQKYKALAEKQQATLADAPAVIAAYRDMAAMWLDAKRSQVEALNEVGLSLEEYRWVREQAYRAIGMAYVDLDLAKLTANIQNAVESGQPAELRGALEAAGPAINKKLVDGFKKQLEENLALASFGL